MADLYLVIQTDADRASGIPDLDCEQEIAAEAAAYMLRLARTAEEDVAEQAVAGGRFGLGTNTIVSGYQAMWSLSYSPGTTSPADLLNDDGTPKYTPCTRKALLMDTNPPEDDHWWYQLAEDGCLRTNQSKEAKQAVSEIFDFFRGPAPFIVDNGDNYRKVKNYL